MNDLPFKPGDKVMRVKETRNKPGLDYFPIPDEPHKGEVYCIKACYSVSNHTVIDLVGYDHVEAEGGAFLAEDFRKVEEIQLCVKAAEAFKNPKKEQQPA